MGSHHTRGRQELLRRGLLFGRRLHQSTPGSRRFDRQRPGGSACEAGSLANVSMPPPWSNHMELWRQTEANYDPKAEQEKYEKQKSKWFVQVKAAERKENLYPRAPRATAQPDDRTAPPRQPLQWGTQNRSSDMESKRHLVPRREQLRPWPCLPGSLFPL